MAIQERALSQHDLANLAQLTVAERKGQEKAQQIQAFLSGTASRSNLLVCFSVNYPNNPSETESHQAFVQALELVTDDKLFKDDSREIILKTSHAYLLRQVVAVERLSDDQVQLPANAAYVAYLATAL